MQLGYVTAERAPRVGQLMRLGHEVVAVFQEATRYGAVVRLAFDGEEPVLPSARPVEREIELADTADWYPDEDWADDFT